MSSVKNFAPLVDMTLLINSFTVSKSAVYSVASDDYSNPIWIRFLRSDTAYYSGVVDVLLPVSWNVFPDNNFYSVGSFNDSREALC